jgi:hypothetical protein
MILEAAKLDARQYTVQYELLRSQVIGTARENIADQPRGIGLALLLSEGMPGWLKSVGEALRVSLAPRAVELPEPSPDEASSQ